MIDKNRSDHEHIMPLNLVKDNSAVANLSTKKIKKDRKRF